MPPTSALLPMEEVERRYVTHVLQALGGRKASAARVLGMDRRTLYRKLERWEQEASPGNGGGRATGPTNMNGHPGGFC
jgi:two-component system response regulator HydG